MLVVVVVVVVVVVDSPHRYADDSVDDKIDDELRSKMHELCMEACKRTWSSKPEKPISSGLLAKLLDGGEHAHASPLGQSVLIVASTSTHCCTCTTCGSGG
jgi:hypothetical protein